MREEDLDAYARLCADPEVKWYLPGTMTREQTEEPGLPASYEDVGLTLRGETRWRGFDVVWYAIDRWDWETGDKKLTTEG